MQSKSGPNQSALEAAERPIAEVVVVTCNSAPYIGACLASIPCGVFPTIVVDNGSSDKTLEIIRSQYPRVTVVENSANLGYGPACNIGFRRTRAEYVVISNADVVYSRGAIETLVAFLKANPKVGVTAPQLIYPNGKWQISYGDVPAVWTGVKDVLGVNSLRRWVRKFFWPRRIDRKPKDVPYVAGAVLAFPREAFEEASGFDENFYFYADESDLCIRLRKSGWRVVSCPLTQVVHVGGADSTRTDVSGKFVRHMADSQSKLAQKHLPPWEAQFYMYSQWYFFHVSALICRGLRVLLPRPRAAGMTRRIQLFDAYSKVLKDYLKTGAPAIPTSRTS